MYNMTDPNTDYMYNSQPKPEMQPNFNCPMQNDQNYMPQHGLQPSDIMTDYYGYNPTINDNNQNIYAQQPQQLDNQIVHHQHHDQPLQQHHAPHPMLSYHPPLDTLFDQHASDYIKIILKLYLDVKSELMTLTINDFFNFENDFDLIIEIMRLNSIKFLKFAENIPGKPLTLFNFVGCSNHVFSLKT